MGLARRLRSALGRIDAYQRRRPALAFPIAVLKKFGDDRAGVHAALIAYFGFFSLFPLLLVLISVLAIVLAGHPALQERIVDSALSQFPVIGEQIRSRARLEALRGSALAIGVGAATALWAGMGVARAAQRAMNTVWNVPRAEWPGFLGQRIRAAAMLAVLGTIVLGSSVASGLGSSNVTAAVLLRVCAWGLSLALNLALFALAFRVLTARPLGWRDVLPGAAAAAVAWSVLQGIGGWYLTRQVAGASDVYGTFALVIGLLVWISLGAQVTLLCAEINVVRLDRLWPRSLAPPPFSEGDRAVYASVVERERIRPEIEVTVAFGPRGDREGPGRREGTGPGSRGP